MAIALVASVSNRALTPGDDITSDAIDTTGANLLVFVANKALTSVTISDSKGNTWTPRTAKTLTGGSTEQTQIHYCAPTSVGSGHTFTVTSDTSGSYSSVTVLAFSGAHATPYDTESAGATDVGGTTIQPGSLTPSADGAVIVASAVQNGTMTNSFTVDGGFTEAADSQYNNFSVGASVAYLIQTSAAAANPTFTFVDSSSGMAAVMAAFKAAAGSSTALPVLLNLRRQYTS